MTNRLDLQHLQRIAAILDAIPGDTSLARAMVALEDAFVVCDIALNCGVSLDMARELHRQTITEEETRQLLAGNDKVGG